MKIGFTVKPPLLPVANRRWRLSGSLVFHLGEHTFIVPDGTVTDLASVPRLLWVAFPPFGTYTYAAVLHDWAYQSGLPRHLADGLFLTAMKISGTHPFTRTAMYLAVRLFGSASYRARRRRSGDVTPP